MTKSKAGVAGYRSRVEVALATLAGLLLSAVSISSTAASQATSIDRSGIGDRLDAFVTSVAGATAFSGTVLVARKGEILLRKGYGEANRELGALNTPETKYRVGSITKTVTALAVLQLHERGELDLDHRVSKYLPELPQGDRLTVRQLLNHTSGLPLDWRPEWHEKRVLSLQRVLELVADQELVFEPGSAEEYSNSGYAVLARVVEIASGDSYDEYVEREILTAAGMVDSDTDRPEEVVSGRASGYVFGENREGDAAIVNAEYLRSPSLLGQASMRSTVDDLRSYDRALREGRLLGAGASELLGRRNAVSEFTLGSWLVASHPDLGSFHYLGGVSSGFTAVIYRYLDRDLVIIVLANHQSADVFFVTRGLANLLAGREVYHPSVRRVMVDPPTDGASLAGSYVLESGDRFEILRRDGRLFVASHSDPPEELFAERSGFYFSTLHDLQIGFTIEHGCVVEVAWTYQGDSEQGSPVGSGTAPCLGDESSSDPG